MKKVKLTQHKNNVFANVYFTKKKNIYIQHNNTLQFTFLYVHYFR